MPPLTILELGPHDYAEFGPRIADIERDIDYPLGDDRFRIDHGDDYFAFFRRLGDLAYFVALEEERVVGVLAVVRRTFPGAWYACDLKVAPDARSKALSRELGAAFAAKRLAPDDRGYGISMNPAEGPNRVVRMLRRLPRLDLMPGPTLRLYSLDRAQMIRAADAITARRGPISYRSLSGVKDIVLQSTGRPMPLLHVQFGPCAARGTDEPVDDAVHMFCVPDDDPLLGDLDAIGLTPSASATVVHRGMIDQDWSFVLTSDI